MADWGAPQSDTGGDGWTSSVNQNDAGWNNSGSIGNVILDVARLINAANNSSDWKGNDTAVPSAQWTSDVANGKNSTFPTNDEFENGGTRGLNTDIGDGFNEFGASNADADNKCRNCGQEGVYAINLVIVPVAYLHASIAKRRVMRPRIARKTASLTETMFPIAHLVKPGQCLKLLVMNGIMTTFKQWLPHSSPEEFELTNSQALKILTKADRTLTYESLETQFRAKCFGYYLIAMEKDIPDTFTIVNLQGKLDCKYAVTISKSQKAQRTTQKERWPPSPEENLERLKNAGIPMDRGIPKCSNCNELGHRARACPQERIAREFIELKCANCDEMGHAARDCPKPRDWSRVKCNNCGEMGHTVKKCKQPIKEDAGGAGGLDPPAGAENTGSFGNFGQDNFNDPGGFAPASSNGWNNTASPAAEGWNNEPPAPVAAPVVSGGW
ncbi:MAG: hypothetical protein Q9227_002191 [Pyrenula ochraceoflavens]